MCSLYGFGIILVMLLSCKELHARGIPETNSDESQESKASRYNFLDRVSASKIECLLKFIDQPDANLECIHELFGDRRSRFLLNELREELERDYPLDEGMITAGVDADKDGDQLVADLNTLSEKTGPLSTVNDDIPIISSNIEKRVEEQVDTPKKEQRKGSPPGESNVVAEVVKTTDEDDEDENEIDDEDETEDDYEYNSSLVSKLYNMLQDLIMKETFDYGLNMNEDDDDSDEDEQPENTTATEEEQEAEMGRESEEEDEDTEEEEDTEQVANELGPDRIDEIDNDEEDEIEKELEQMHSARNVEDGSDDPNDEDDEEDINAIEHDLVQELDRMLSMAKQEAGGKGPDIDDVISSNKFLKDLQNMEKQLKHSSD